MLEGALYTVLLGGLILFVLYRRARRLFGRQEFRHRRLIFRLVMFSAILILMIPMAIVSGLSSVSGVILGVGLGFMALTRTKFEVEDKQVFYTPNTLMSSVVISLFLGRLIYRLFTMGDRIRQVQDFTNGDLDLLGSRQPGSLTILILFILLGYYLFYYSGVLLKGKGLQTETGAGKA